MNIVEQLRLELCPSCARLAVDGAFYQVVGHPGFMIVCECLTSAVIEPCGYPIGESRIRWLVSKTGSKPGQNLGNRDSVESKNSG